MLLLAAHLILKSFNDGFHLVAGKVGLDVGLDVVAHMRHQNILLIDKSVFLEREGENSAWHCYLNRTV